MYGRESKAGSRVKPGVWAAKTPYHEVLFVGQISHQQAIYLFKIGLG